MAMTDRSACLRALTTLIELREFLLAEKACAEAGGGLVDSNREERFLSDAEVALREGTRDSLQELLQSMRGVSHYFGSCCGDVRRGDELCDRLYEEVLAAILEERGRPA